MWQMHARTLARCSARSEEHTSELQSHLNLVCRLLLEKKKYTYCRRRVTCGGDLIEKIETDTVSVSMSWRRMSRCSLVPAALIRLGAFFFFFKLRRPPKTPPLPHPPPSST